MKPETEKRRTIIREWMRLPHAKRQTADQAMAFAAEAVEKYPFKSNGNRRQRVLVWLTPRVGRP